ncbi:MAG: tetratricopeptide repeat protein [Flavobacteriaceae bacterium]|nr:tetratricopeptide repeat protein [Flavobacteriaceae bacterium]
MKKQHVILVLLLFIIIGNSNAQQTKIYTHDNVTYDKALSLYKSEQFLVSQTLFEKLKNTTDDTQIKGNCAYYIANSAVRLNQRNADELMERFVEDYPTSNKRNAAFNDVGDYYFRNSKYAYALKWYDRVDDGNLSVKEMEHYSFKKGYSLFHTNQKKKAKKYFNKIEDSELYGAQAKYYLGFLAYQGDDYNEASSYFDQVQDQKKYQEKMAYFQADMNFKLGSFDKAIDLASQRLPLAMDDEERSQLNKIIGESFFNLKKYDKALSYLKEYKGRKGKWTNTDHYQLGYVYYKRTEFQAAISEFNKIIDGENSIAQNAYYHLAECYLKINKKNEALNAFKNASEMDFDPKIKADAALNYAKLSYEVGNSYQSVPEVLSNYISAYPNSSANVEIENLLIDSYITSKNYKEALGLLESKSGLNYKTAYQKVAFYRAIALFNEGLFSDAGVHFDKSLKEPRTPKFTARAQFWKAECDYLLDNYQDAIIGYKEFALNDSIAQYKEAGNLNYQLGYGYFKQKEYQQAIPYFLSFIEGNTNDELRLIDSYLRLGDSYFVTTDYWKAMETYNEVKKRKGVDADYAHFQKAISYGFVGKSAEKITDLILFLADYSNSQYTDDALFELGNTYVLINDTSNALKTFDKLLYEYPKSSYVSRGLLKQGLVHYNNDANEQALNKFKQVASNYPGSSEANQAVATARLIYIDLDRVGEYVVWVKTLDFVAVSDADLDNTTYEAAEKQFLANNVKKAIKSYTGYLSSFPKGINATKAHFYLGQSYFKNNEKAATISHYIYVIEKGRNVFTEQALARLSQVYLEAKNWQEAKLILTRLENEADFPQNKVFALTNLMKSNYELDNYQEAVVYAEKVLQNPKIEDAIKSDAQVIIARSAIQTGDESKARISYGKVQEIAKGSLAAEALYYDAYFTHKDKDYAVSNVKIQNLTRDYSGYKYYAAKGLVLMAKNYYELEDSFQATYILEKVIENFTKYEDVVTDAKSELQRIKIEEAKRNSSINVDPIEEDMDQENEIEGN